MTVTHLKFRSDVTVELEGALASDDAVMRAARVSTQGADVRADDAAGGLINYLMRARHGSPFEHNCLTFFVSAPIFVFREFQRHRIASYNEESARYRQLDPVFYVPDPQRKLVQVGKPGHYTFAEGTQAQYDLMVGETMAANASAYEAYQLMLDTGITREVARGVLPVNIYSSMYVTMNARALMNFLSLRVSDPDARFPSTPQREIEMCAEKMERLWAAMMPLTHQAFIRHGRVSP